MRERGKKNKPLREQEDRSSGSPGKSHEQITGWDEPKMEKARGVDGDRHVVTQDRVLIKSEDISPQPA